MGGDEAIPAPAQARFIAAEARLYPMVVVDPEGYRQVTTLVGLVADELRADCADIDTLLRRRDELAARVPEIAAAASLSLGGLPAETVVDAASAIRCRELAGARRQAVREQRIEAARAAGSEWFVEEPDPLAVLAGSYRRVELHLPSGSTLITAMEADPRSGAVYSIELIPADGTRPDADTRTFTDRDAWESAAAQCRARLSGRE
ncbi:MAG TPA: hypothetical protein VIU11_08320 [Nakamurella sp.]